MKNTTEKLFPLLIPLLFVFPLFKESISSLFFILVALNTLVYTYAENKFSPALLKKMAAYTMPFWIVAIGCLVKASSFDDLVPIKNSLYFLLFPLIFPLIPDANFSKEKVHFYIQILKNVCAVVVVGYLAAFLVKYDFKDFFVFKFGIPKFRDFVYYEILFFKIHPTYFTAILVFCIAYSLERVFKNKKYVELLYIGMFILMTFMLLSKINIVFVIILVFGMLLFRSGMSFPRRLMASTVLIIAVAAMLVSIPGISNRFKEMVEKYNKPPVGLEYHSTNIRVAIYTCSAKIVKQNFLTGIGYNNIGTELKECFSDNYNSSFYNEKSYITHNYFMYILISGGIFSLLAFLYYIGSVVFAGYKMNYFVVNVFLLNILLLCMSEDYFYRQFGLFYFSLIFFTFLRMHKSCLTAEAMSNGNG
ncbi:MAG TPA: O-antigen ligase family protein [Flavobacterium sp.]